MRIEFENFKKYLSIIVSMDDESFEKAIIFLKVRTILKGHYLIKEGQRCKEIAFVHKGLFRVFNHKDGVEVNSCFCFENSIACSISSIVNQIPSSESIQALEDSTVVTFSPESCNQLSEENKQWQLVRQLLTEKECIRLSERANSLCFESAIEKYQNLLQFQPEIIQRISIQHIASYLGVSRETLSRIRSKVS
jgi:CRP-like cAMP-binding protein